MLAEGAPEVFPNIPLDPAEGAAVDPPKSPLVGGLPAGVIVDENNPPGLAEDPAPWAPPKRDDPPAAGVEEFPPAGPNEKDGEPVLGLFPKSPPEAGAVVDGLFWAFDEGVEPEVPKLNDIVYEFGGWGRAGYRK